MSEKQKKFEKQMNELISKGNKLHLTMQYECHKDRFTQIYEKRFGQEKTEQMIEKLPKFKEEYQSWYSESLAVVKQILPDRVSDFMSYYEYPRVRKEIDFENYMIRDYLQGLRVSRGEETIVDAWAAIPEFEQQLNIVKAARELLESTLIDLTSILQADLFDSEVDSARALVKSGFVRASGAICGVVMEKHLGHVCDVHKITIRKKKPTISDFNDKLKESDVITVPQWRFIQHLADIRNICDHAREREPSKEEVGDLISGTEKILKTVF